MSMRILFVHNAPRSFVRTDLEILRSAHEVDELDLSVRGRIVSLPLRLARADLVYVWFAGLHALGPVLLAALLRKPSVVVVGGYDTADMPEIGYGHMAHPWKRYAVRLICSTATALVANSRTAAEEVRRTTGTKTPIRVIHHGFNLTSAAQQDGREPLALSVGNVTRSNLTRKGHEVFLRAAALMPEVRFVLAGSSPDGIADRLRSSAPPNVTIPGFVPDGELDHLYARAAAYVQPSVHEGFGCSVVEAMLFGCVPVVSRRGALPEVVAEHGEYVDEADPADVARGIRAALAASAERRRAIVRYAATRFSLDRRRAALLDLVEEAGRPRTPAERLAGPLDVASARVTVVIPTRNEARHIGSTLDSVLAQTFPAERMAILVVDGMSTDGTRDLVLARARTHVNLRMLDNPSRSTPAALNIGITASNAEVIVRVDGHTEIAPDYVERCVALLVETGAGNVGGLMRPRGRGTFGNAVARATRSRFGIGNARFRYLERQIPVDTVYLGAFRREVLEEVGSFDEELIRNQDDELNYRIRRAGYTILLSPDIMSSYTPRDSVPALWRQYFEYGSWKVRVVRKHPGSVQARHLAPPLLVLTLTGSIALFIATRRRRVLLPPAVYASAVVAASIANGERQPRLTTALLAVFPCLHIAYGAGWLAGLGRAALAWRSALVPSHER